MTKEVWKDIKNYEGFYQVSNLGRVRSLERISVQKHRVKERVLASTLDTYGYCLVTLRRDGKRKTHKVHRLVAEAFLSNPDNLPQINHKDECKTNNKVSNLEFCSPAYNTNYGNRNERAAKGHEKPIFAITSSGNRYLFQSATKAAELLGLNRANVSSCLNSKRKHCGDFAFEWVEQHA